MWYWRCELRTVYFCVICFAVALTGRSIHARETTNLFPNVTARICEGKIVTEFSPLWVHATWRIEWPEAISNVSRQVLGIIQRQMIDDCFGSMARNGCGGEDKKVSEVYSTPDRALQLVFSRAYSKLDVPPEDDHPTLRVFDFIANLKIHFVNAGYMGYVLKGYENEGGNGCHSYVVANVLSLTTGQLLKESDFMTHSGLAAFPKAFFDRITYNEAVRSFVIGDVNDATAGLGNFVIVPEGIRWWVPAYSIFAGAAGVQDLLMTWQELKPFMKPGVENVFQAIFVK